jgi:transaldolase
MNMTAKVTTLGQSLWLDNISRNLLDDGTLQNYIQTLGVCGLTSNPTIFDEAISTGESYDESIAKLAGAGKNPAEIFNELALEDLRRAADLFRPLFERTNQIDGWVSMEVSPLLASDPTGTVAAARAIHEQAERANLFVKIPGTPEGIRAIEESIFQGIPVNVTLLFSDQQYLAAAKAYMRGIERRIAAGRDPKVGSVASLFVSRWDKAVAERVPQEWRNRLGIAVARRTYVAYRELLASARWRHLESVGAQAMRLLWASTGTKDPAASDTLYVDALALAGTINTLPDKTLRAYGAHGASGGAAIASASDSEGAQGDSEAVLAHFEESGIDIQELGRKLQRDGASAFVASWNHLLAAIESKSHALAAQKVSA